MPTIEQARAWYPDDDPVHGFDHVVRVYQMAEHLAAAEGADVEIVRAAALLHDAQGGETSGGEAGRSAHHLRSADFAGRILAGEGWPPDRIAAVQHCIRAHRFRDDAETPQTLEAQILFDADKLDVIGALGVVRTLAYSVVVGQPAYTEPSQKFLRTGKTESGEAHSSYHEYLYKLRNIRELFFTRKARQIAEGRHSFIQAFFEQLAAEMRGER